MSANAMISVRNVVKRFGAFTALDDISLDIMEGEFFSLLGPSGCGKTTLLRMIGGFDNPSSGAILISGKDMTGVPANHRPTNMVFQSYAIFPHLNVSENVAYGLKRLRLGREEESKRVAAALDQVELKGLGSRMGNQLSGGQRQRVALARALVLRPKVLLLDEPLSALDMKLREQMQVELRALQQSLGITFILVTHDQEEALIMSDRIAVMFDGQIAQMASPEELYRTPRTRRVASFIGVMNFLPARMKGESPEGIEIDIPALGSARIPRDRVPEGLRPERIESIGIRPEMLTILFDEANSAEREAEGQVVANSYYGDMTYYDVRLAGQEAQVTISMRNTAGRSVARPGTTVRVGWGAESVVLFD